MSVVISVIWLLVMLRIAYHYHRQDGMCVSLRCLLVPVYIAMALSPISVLGVWYLRTLFGG